MTSQKPNEQLRTGTEQIKEQLLAIERADALYGCHKTTTPGVYRGWLYNLYETVLFGDLSEVRIPSAQGPPLRAAVECYFMTTALDLFKIVIPVKPYFYIQAPVENYLFIQERLLLHYSDLHIDMTLVERNDLSVQNHIANDGIAHLRLSFDNLTNLRTVSAALLGLLRQKELSAVGDIYNRTGIARITPNMDIQSIPRTLKSLVDYIGNVLEHDVNLTARFLIDNELTMSTWYNVTVKPELETPLLERLEGGEFELPPVPKVLAYDIETTKKPLRFPNAEAGDQIMCISYMFDDQGYLLINRSIFSRDITDFEYTPKPEFPGKFACFNLPTEKDLLIFFFTHIRTARPNIFATFNGDFFDWPFVDVRAAAYGMNLLDEIGILKSESTSRAGLIEKQYYARAVPHLDCFRWVRRDSYLPQGSQGLKAVTRAKLKYHPDELSPELMVSYAQTDPQVLASYSVSDAVATYYLYRKYVHPFIFALGTILPLNPDDILRRGTGTLCEHLLMVEAYQANVPFPNKHNDPLLQVVFDASKEKRILLNQTYVGGKVEAINAGVYRNDIAYDFGYYSEAFRTKRFEGYGYLLRYIDRDLIIQLSVSKICNEHMTTYQSVLNMLEEISLEQKVIESICERDSHSSVTELCFCRTPNKNIIWLPDTWTKTKDRLKEKLSKQFESYSNHVDTLIRHIESTLCSNYSEVRSHIIEGLIACSNIVTSKPLLYHLDVAAMYPNIMLTNKLQPTAIVDPNTTCACCDFSTIKEAQVCQRIMEWDWRGSYYPLDFSEYLMIKNQAISQIGADRWMHALTEFEKARLLHERLETYSKSQYKLKQKTEEMRRKTIVCQRENSFFIDTVRKFRDRRYRFKREQKDHSLKLSTAKKQLAKLIEAGLEASEDAQNLRREIDSQAGLIVLKESLQLAHKCILNSFYGYAMRKGSRWYSLEMAAAVTHAGATIIKRARTLIEMIGFVLELDTDGIWCCLPSSFPETCTFIIIDPGNADAQSSRKVSFSYPGTMLNALTQTQNTNKQYLINVIHNKISPSHDHDANLKCDKNAQGSFSGFDSNDMSLLLYASSPSRNLLLGKSISSSNTQLESPIKAWKRVNECTIEFEVDGPYSCMVLSAAREEGVRIKKKYAVFDLSGGLSELKGFELKRRGELKIIKSFQTRVFSQFLKGRTLEDAYGHAAKIANTYLDIIYAKGSFLTDQQLITLISEASTLKNSLNSTPKNRKSTSITCARRIASFLDPLFASVDGLSVEYIISKFPEGTPVSERAVPVQIFNSPEYVRSKFLRQWIGDHKGDTVADIRELIDWDYYLARLSGAIYKIIVVPSGLQGIATSPVQRITFPDWLVQSQVQLSTKQSSNILQQYLKIGNEKSKITRLNNAQATEYENFYPNEEPLSSANTSNIQEDDPNESEVRNDTILTETESDDSSDNHEEKDSHARSYLTENKLIHHPKTAAEFSQWYMQQTAYWAELVEKNIIGKPYYLSHNVSLSSKHSVSHQLHANRATYDAGNDFKLHIVTITVLPSGKVSCFCINKNRIMKRIIFGTSVRIYFNLRTAIPQDAIAEYSSPTLTIVDVTKKNLVLPDMACCTQLLLYEMSTDTYTSGQSSFQELKSSVAVADVYEADVSGPFRFLIEFRHKLDLPETYESRRFLNMGEVPYTYSAKYANQGSAKDSTDWFFIFPFEEDTPPCYPVGFVMETDKHLTSLLPDGRLALITVTTDSDPLTSDTYAETVASDVAFLFTKLLNDSIEHLSIGATKPGQVTLDSLVVHTFKHILRVIKQCGPEQKEKMLGLNTQMLKNVLLFRSARDPGDAVEVLAELYSQNNESALVFWKFDCKNKNRVKSLSTNIYFKEQHFIIELPESPCPYTEVLISQDMHTPYNQEVPTAEPSLKQPPVLSAHNSETTRSFVTVLQPLVSLIIDAIVAQYISHIFTVPINLVLDESEFSKVVLPQDLLSETQASCTTTLLLDTLIAREYANNNMLLPSRDRKQSRMFATEYTLRSGMYHGYSLMIPVRNTFMQLLINYLIKLPVVITAPSSQAVRALPAHVTSAPRLRILSKTLKGIAFSQSIPAQVKHHISSMMKTYLFSAVSLLFCNGMIEILYEELQQFYATYNNILAESGYILVYADITKNIIASEKMDPELLLNSYRYLLRNIYSTGLFQLYELPSVEAVCQRLCACPIYSNATKEALVMQLRNNSVMNIESSVFLSKVKAKQGLESSPSCTLRSPATANLISKQEEMKTGETPFCFNSNTPQITVIRHLAFIDIANYFGYSCDLDHVIGHFSAHEPLPKELRYIFQLVASAYSLIMNDSISKSAKSVSSANAELKSSGTRFIEFLQKCVFDMTPFTKDEQAIFMDKLVALQANAKIRETLHALADLFHIYYIKNITQWPQKVTCMYAQAGMSKLLDSLSPGIYFIRTFLYIFSLDERIKDVTRSFCWGILPGIGVYSPLDTRIKYGELFQEYNVSNILCDICKQLNCLDVMRNKVFYCSSCGSIIESSVLERSLSKQLSQLVTDYFSRQSKSRAAIIHRHNSLDKNEEKMLLDRVTSEIRMILLASQVHNMIDLFEMCMWWDQQLNCHNRQSSVATVGKQ
ncbi:DNA polymerase epsilon, catalytic subunit [Giardia lamblia P15]|uniref:DNA-directed DNA polymerase n=1 Tax=Giardia intestinalis (strain P15) TaxID=658858 RepID=E1F3H2_GIAIA|nr:DNA polymerase epsilon, catalytic subunit [Giardia lamblia P15]